MAYDQDVNLLPEKDRRAGSEAVKKAMQKQSDRDIKLVVPTAPQDEKKQPKAKAGFWSRFAKKKNAPATADLPTAVSAPTANVSVPTPPRAPSVPAPAPAPKTVEIKPAPAKPMTTPLAPKLNPPVKAVEKKTSAQPPVPAVAAPVPTPAPKKEKAKPKMHEPQEDLSFQAPNVNLVPEYVKAEAGGRSWVLYVSMFAFVVAVWVIASGVSIARAKRAEARLAEINARLTQVNAAVRNFEDEKTSAQALQKQFTLVETALNNHVYWTPFLQKLEETTIPDVYYMTMTSARSGEVRLRAIAKTYTAAARQIRAFERATHFVQSVEIHEAVLEPQPEAALPVPVVAFDIQLMLTPNALQIEAPQEAAAETNP